MKEKNLNESPKKNSKEEREFKIFKKKNQLVARKLIEAINKSQCSMRNLSNITGVPLRRLNSLDEDILDYKTAAQIVYVLDIPIRKLK